MTKTKKLKEHYLKSKGLHLNYEIITDIVDQGAKVLDLACGSGELLKMLKDKKQVLGRGVEINQDNVIECLEKGLSVVQGDIDEGLKEYPDKSYDYVILNQTLQSTHKTEYVIQEMLRVGNKVVVSFPNFAYWRIRSQLFFEGRMPKSNILPFHWYNTPNIHLLALKDFLLFTTNNEINILDTIFMTRAAVRKSLLHRIFPNLLAEEVMCVMSKDI